MPSFALNGVALTIFPQSAHWVDVVTGYDHAGRPIFAATKNLEWGFDNMSVSLYSQFSALNGASLTSVATLGLDSGSYTTFSNAGINLQIKDRPHFLAGYADKFTVLITGIQVS